MQVSKHCYEFADHRFPATTPYLPASSDICEYCDTYATAWHLWPHLRLGTRVLRVSRSSCAACMPSASSSAATVEHFGCCFTVELAESAGDSAAECDTVTETFTHVVHAIGLRSNKPCVPEFPGAASFSGTLLHSSERQDDVTEFSGKAVVGSGKSAQDAALAAVNAGAESVTQV
ncbi:MAG: hypothetical protein HC767_07800 [Akkermansiaceae bacterium]|nr:hypothetical protein [Akkermansiaceae bacterium]